MADSGRAPVIGLTTYGPEVEGLLASFSLPQLYVDAVAASGGIPLLLAPSEIPLAETLDVLDGLIIAGGGDLDPALYGGREHESVYMVNPTRDRFELDLARTALASHGIPVFGICRGMQVMNLALGGDLDTHVPDVYGDQVAHRLPPRQPTEHEVCAEPGSALEKICGVAEFPVCSWHHQSVRRLGRDVEAIAHAADGVVEGIVYTDHSWAIGVQWHPEMQLPGDERQKRLFDALVLEARRGRGA